ncbi:MAG: hypothetical protein QOH73_2431 [Gaiellaceae bacterium]|jgi:branched-subunit amino acid transport protein|nr:hypothetical protein [Gaiellaceae bacterium]
MTPKHKLPRERRYVIAFAALVVAVLGIRVITVVNRTKITDYMSKRLGFAGTMVVFALIFALILWLAKRLDDKRRE